MRLDIPAIGPAVVTLGVFDGVHLGHRHLLESTARAASEREAATLAIVFEPHPEEVIRPGTRVARLLPPDVTRERLAEAGADHVVVVPFDEGLRALPPDDFLAALAPGIQLRGVAMTPESAFGHRRTGTLERVAEIGAGAGFDAIRVDPLLVDGEPVSSSRIRTLLADGHVGEATALMGAPPLLRGIVVEGDHRGRELGFPTANLAFDYTPALPALGIYLGHVSVPERDVGPGHPALVSVGVRPTFHDDGRLLVEVYLLDWDGDLYGTTLTVELDARLREERRFASVRALVEQMQADEAEARRLLSSVKQIVWWHADPGCPASCSTTWLNIGWGSSAWTVDVVWLVTLPYVLGWLLLMVAFLITQTRFYNVHRRVRGWWRAPSDAARTTLLYTPTEYRAMWRATFRADPDGSVERARRVYLVVMAVTLVYFIAALPAALVFGV